MVRKQQEKQPSTPAREENEGRERLEILLRKNVIRSLGQPTNLHHVQIRELWDHHYRVNIVVGADAASIRIAHSFFLLSDSDGNVVESTPRITKHY
jgi:hypothetical protein